MVTVQRDHRARDIVAMRVMRAASRMRSALAVERHEHQAEE